MTFLQVMMPLSAPAPSPEWRWPGPAPSGEFGATITFAGNLPGRTQTMPLAVYVALQEDLELAVTLSLILVMVSVALLVALRGLPGLSPAESDARDPGR
jgi:molybdate transport system permease protein